MVMKMAGLYGTLFLFLSVSLFPGTNAAKCTDSDFKTYPLPCDPSTRTRKIVTYLDNKDCTLEDISLIKKPQINIPCECPPGKGLNVTKNGINCSSCGKGSFSAGGEDISEWRSWTQNGTVPPPNLGLSSYCEVYRSYVPPCEQWKASFFNDSLESGENSKSRCLSSVLTLTKQFVMLESYVKFTYRVEGRNCYSSYVGCDGLGFYVDNKQVMPFVGNQFVWKTVRYNVTAGFHQLKWLYRKNCYSFPTPGISDKAFIQSIALVGTLEPQTQCKNCPPGRYSDKDGASDCTKCSYFKYQPNPGQKSCIPCESNSYSMLGSAYCIPLDNCTLSDLVMAPEPLKSCYDKKGTFYRKIIPKFASVLIGAKPHKLCRNDWIDPLAPKEVKCKCQPGFELRGDGKGHPKCRMCPKGMHSVDGMKCLRCPSGQVALFGKHYYTWEKDGMPAGFVANCVGDCSVKDGWIPSGDHIRTSRVVGDVDSFIESAEYKVMSNIARINFTCSIGCNISKPNSRVLGNHLADIQFCNLVFQVWFNGSLAEQVNCTKPKGRYVYRHGRYRDSRPNFHTYPLKNGTYKFRWVFHQADEMRSISSSFEAKLYNISIVGIEGGSAMNCTPCAAGSFSVAGNTDCSLCSKGSFSPAGSSSCSSCPTGTFADTPGSGECLKCASNTKSLPTRDGCTTNNCMFSPSEGVDYDLAKLSRVNGNMFEVLTYQRKAGRNRKPDRSKSGVGSGARKINGVRRLTVWPYRPSLYVNLCTVKHTNSSCTFRSKTSGVRESLPVMACRRSWWRGKDTSIGRVIGFRPKEDIRSGLMVDLLHGDQCYTRPGRPSSRYNTTIDLMCDAQAGVGSPGPLNNFTQVFRPPCSFFLVWRSLYACPKCRKQDFEKVTHQCVNGIANVTYSTTIPCWGSVEGIAVGVTNTSCASQVARIQRITSTVNKVLIGVGVVVIVALIILASYFFYKHRDIKYKYYSTFARNKPMSRLEEEEEDFGPVEGDMFHDTRNIVQ